MHLAASDDAVEHQPHSVEYITDGDVPLTVEHVQAESADEDVAVG